MAQRLEHIELAIEELERYGLKGEVSERGKHLELAWQSPLGRRFVIVPKTPSDWRGCLNSRSDVRKLLRADNLQPKAINELTFQKAMSLPKVQALPREQLYKNDIDTLTDMVFELQANIAVLQQQNQMLQDRMNSATVESKVISRFRFGNALLEPEVVEDHSDEIIEVVNTNAFGNKQTTSNRERVLGLLSTTWCDIKDIIKSAGINRSHVNTIMQHAKRNGIVEHGLRGQWRLKS